MYFAWLVRSSLALGNAAMLMAALVNQQVIPEKVA
jgi:hypothetical protein